MYSSTVAQPVTAKAATTIAGSARLRAARCTIESGESTCLCEFGGRLAIIAIAVSSPSDLKNAGLKATVPRLKIINLFETSKVRHLTAEDVYRKLLDEGLDIGLATVYRVLTQFEQAGLLIRHHFESGKAVFELNEGHHHDHLVCIQCGRVEEFYDAGIEKRQTAVASERGFKITEHALYLYAECVKPRCPYR